MLLKEKSHGTVGEPEKEKHDKRVCILMDREGVNLTIVLFKILPVPSSSPFQSSYVQPSGEQVPRYLSRQEVSSEPSVG